MKKHCFLTFFAERRAKSSKKAVFSHFLRTSNDVFRKSEKHCFLALFTERRSCENIKKRCFCILCELCTKFVEKREKALFSHNFWGISKKEDRKTLFFRNFAIFVQSFSINVKKHCFLTHLRNVVPKVKKKCLSDLLRTLYKVSRKTWKNTVFSHFLGNVVQKAQKTMFFTFTANFVQSVSKNVKKHCFLTLSDKRLAISSNNGFFRIFANFVQSFSKDVKKHCFPKLSDVRRAKNLKKRFFFAFFAICVQSVSKNVKKHCFLTLLGEHRAKSSKNAISFLHS